MARIHFKKALIRHIYHSIHLRLMSNWFQGIVLFFIIGSISSVILSSFEEFKPYSTYLYTFNYLASFIFTIEYGLRIAAAPNLYPDLPAWKARVRYLLSFYGIIDFTAILPFLLIYLYRETAIHLVMLPYILIFFKLIRYSRSFRFIGEVLRSARGGLTTAYTACLILIAFSGVLMYYIEQRAQPEIFANIGDGMWWAIVTFTTVGYGDIYPITPIGRLLSAFISLIGIAMIARPTGIITAAFMNKTECDKKSPRESKK